MAVSGGAEAGWIVGVPSPIWTLNSLIGVTSSPVEGANPATVRSKLPSCGEVVTRLTPESFACGSSQVLSAALVPAVR